MNQRVNERDINGIGMTSQRTRERLVQRLMDSGIDSIAVLDVMRSLPRHIFLDQALAHRAYEDTALPIGHGQTLSQPYIVARMSAALIAGGPLRKVLEVGTGSGYQTAVLSRLVGEVYSVERIKALQDKAKERIKLLGARNVRFKLADGNIGWEEAAPFDGIIVTAAPREVPARLREQLTIGGRMVIPVGEANDQSLMLIVRQENGFQHQVLEKVRFVPLLGGVLR